MMKLTEHRFVEQVFGFHTGHRFQGVTEVTEKRLDN